MFPIWVNDGTSEAPEDAIFYVVAKDGIYLKKTMGHFNTLSKVEGISVLGECESFASLDIAKITKRQFAQIVGLFRAVYKKYRSEVNVILHYNIKRKRFRIDIPPQGVTGASVEYENGLETYKGYTRIGTIHSHANMSAFHSGTDQHDEEGWDGLHITLGRMGEEYFDISCSIMSNKERFMVNPEDYIEGAQLVEYEEESKYQSFRYIGGVREAIPAAKKLGWRIDTVEKDFKFPKKWLEKVGKYRPKPIFTHGAIGRGVGSYNSLQAFYEFHQGLDSGHGRTTQTNTQNSRIFDGGVTQFEVGENEWSPCAQCPYKDHKSDILMRQLLIDIEEEEAEAEMLAEDLEDEIERQNLGSRVMGEDTIDDLHGYVYDPNVERNSPFHVDDKETPHGITKDKK